MVLETTNAEECWLWGCSMRSPPVISRFFSCPSLGRGQMSSIKAAKEHSVFVIKETLTRYSYGGLEHSYFARNFVWNFIIPTDWFSSFQYLHDPLMIWLYEMGTSMISYRTISYHIIDIFIISFYNIILYHWYIYHILMISYYHFLFYNKPIWSELSHWVIIDFDWRAEDMTHRCCKRLLDGLNRPLTIERNPDSKWTLGRSRHQQIAFFRKSGNHHGICHNSRKLSSSKLKLILNIPHLQIIFPGLSSCENLCAYINVNLMDGISYVYIYIYTNLSIIDVT